MLKWNQMEGKIGCSRARSNFDRSHQRCSHSVRLLCRVQSSGFAMQRDQLAIRLPEADRSGWDRKRKASDTAKRWLDPSLWWSPSLIDPPSPSWIANADAERSNGSRNMKIPFNLTPIGRDSRRRASAFRSIDWPPFRLCQFFASLQQLCPGRVYFWSERQKTTSGIEGRGRKNRGSGAGAGRDRTTSLVCGATRPQERRRYVTIYKKAGALCALPSAKRAPRLVRSSN